MNNFKKIMILTIFNFWLQPLHLQTMFYPSDEDFNEEQTDTSTESETPILHGYQILREGFDLLGLDFSAFAKAFYKNDFANLPASTQMREPKRLMLQEIALKNNIKNQYEDEAIYYPDKIDEMLDPLIAEAERIIVEAFIANEAIGVEFCELFVKAISKNKVNDFLKNQTWVSKNDEDISWLDYLSRYRDLYFLYPVFRSYFLTYGYNKEDLEYALLFPGKYFITRALKSDNVEAIQYLFDIQFINIYTKNNCNNREDNGKTLLHYAVMYNAPKTTALLLKKGCNVNMYDKINETPLHAAARLNADKIIPLLLAAGADVNAFGRGTLLHSAVKTDADKAFSLLIAAGAQIGSGRFGIDFSCLANTLLLDAIELGSSKIVLLLLEAGVDANESSYGKKPLIEAVNYATFDQRNLPQRLKIIESLLKHGADQNVVDGFGRRIFHIEIPLEVRKVFERYNESETISGLPACTIS